MSNVTEILTHKEDALNRRLEQYKNKPNIEKAICIYLDLVQELETVFKDIRVTRSVFSATGAQLDIIGDIVGRARPPGLSDEPYRTLIFIKIGQNVSNGEPERIIQIMKLLSGSSYVHLIDYGNGNIELTVNVDFADQDEIDLVYREIEEVLAGGVRVAAILCADETEAFAFAGNGISPTAKGFDDTTGTSGGKFAIHHTFKEPFAFDGSDTDAKGFGIGSPDPLVGGVFVAV